MLHIINNKEEFEKKILNEKGVCIIDFWAEWCVPCKTFLPIFKEFSKLREDINFFKIDVESNEEIAQNNKIISLPTILFFKDGVEITRKSGILKKSDFLQILEDNKL